MRVVNCTGENCGRCWIQVGGEAGGEMGGIPEVLWFM